MKDFDIFGMQEAADKLVLEYEQCSVELPALITLRAGVDMNDFGNGDIWPFAQMALFASPFVPPGEYIDQRLLALTTGGIEVGANPIESVARLKFQCDAVVETTVASREVVRMMCRSFARHLMRKVAETLREQTNGESKNAKA